MASNGATSQQRPKKPIILPNDIKCKQFYLIFVIRQLLYHLFLINRCFIARIWQYKTNESYNYTKTQSGRW